MKTTSFSPNGLQLTRIGLMNCYLVREPDGFTLIDSGLPGGNPDLARRGRCESRRELVDWQSQE
jgi:hypothetical protein